MSGGFFRGTSADQDTRFSNKQAKLLKTQKFAPELDHLVDMSKVKMDVMKPWIAKRVTELLGFEDEVLINFIYGLLEEKEADGKKIQIQLTGFMEKNTVKFMKELWGLLLSAEQNASGVPQQFLDAKEAEIQQRKVCLTNNILAEDDRIAQEIQKKREKEGRDSELEKQKMMDGDAGNSRSYGDPIGSALNNSNANTEVEMELDFKRSSRTKNRKAQASVPISRKAQASVPISRKAQATVPISRKAQATVPISRKAQATVPISWSISPHSSKSPIRSRRSVSIENEKRTNGTPSIKDRAIPESQYCLRDQERRFDDDNDGDGARIGDHHSPYSERRLSKSLRSPNNEEGNSTHHSSIKSSGKQLPGQDSTDTSGDEEEGSRARENARKANSARRKTKDFSAGVSSPGEKSTFMLHQRLDSLSETAFKWTCLLGRREYMCVFCSSIKKHHRAAAQCASSQQLYDFVLFSSGKGVQKKHPDQLSGSSEDEPAGRRMKCRTDSPDERSPPRIEKDDLHSKDGRNSEHATRGLRDDSDDAIEAKKYFCKANEDSQSGGGSPVKKPKKRTDVNSHIDSGSSGSEEPDKHRPRSEKRRHKKAHKHKKQYDDSSESDSEPDGKEAKRRRKEEKRLRKEERRRRREERYRKRAERHASKQKLKHNDTVAPPSDSEKDQDSDSDVDVRKRGSSAGREESDQKKLEIELREKALESLRAKKAINN
ncbi:Serine/arginine repetitive matrix protein 1 [Dichanthelium oligosanthes]|uniref:Serine/arginine repetitive matrix protein 1 n=1 Tax=Dichanthelium oligosanthes TaxID=888268 RepID=A0A1E5V9Z9_9POAL|nr:Serine/arginine repetitive matrix protein 1 [Dichanthelium oligosanthes]